MDVFQVSFYMNCVPTPDCHQKTSETPFQVLLQVAPIILLKLYCSVNILIPNTTSVKKE